LLCGNKVNEDAYIYSFAFHLCTLAVIIVCDIIVSKQLTCWTHLFFSYRLAPDFIFPAAFEDCVKATKYFLSNAAKFHVNPHRITVFGKFCSISFVWELKVFLLIFSFLAHLFYWVIFIGQCTVSYRNIIFSFYVMS